MEEGCEGVVWYMIRTKKSKSGNVEVLPPQAPTEHPKQRESGGGNGSGRANLPWYMRSRYYCNPPEHTKFKPGNAGGPGRHPYKKFTNTLIKKVETMDPKTGQLVLDELVDALITKSLSNQPASVSALQTLLDRYEGPITQKLELSGAVAHIHTSMSELIQLANLTDTQLLAIEQVGLKALAEAEREARERSEGDG